MKKTSKTNKSNKTKVKETNTNTNSDEFYTKEEIKALDDYHEKTGGKFEDDEIYEIMQKYNNDEKLIMDELNNILRERERGKEFNWQEVGKSKIILIYNIYNYFN